MSRTLCGGCCNPIEFCDCPPMPSKAVRDLREALTRSFLTLQAVYGYAKMVDSDAKKVKDAMDEAERVLNETDDIA